jgi:superfamily II DNA/RNA helicase
VCDHLNRRSLTLDSAGFFVLDEMDRMLDIGLAEQIEAIGRHLPEERQTMMFSATLPDRILKQAARYLREPERVAIGSVSVAAPKVKQEVVHMEESAKYPALLEALGQRDGSVIVFVKTRRGADKMADKLRRLDHGAEALHGDLQQRQRDRVIRGFRQQDHRILVATDIAARGLDIPHIQHVINFDLPQSPEDYIHRIGRTGRAGAEGEALCLIGPDDRRKWKAIQRLLNPEAARQEEREGRRSDGGAERRGGGRHRHGQSPRQGEWQGRPRQEREQGDGEARPFARRDGQRPSFKKADQPQEARRDGQRAERPFDASAKPAFGKPYAKDKNQAQGEAKPWKKTGEWKERKRDQDRPEKPWGEKPRSDKPRGEQTRSDKPWGEKPRGFSAKPYGAPQSKAFGRSRKAA